jgi:hypothetical protein
MEVSHNPELLVATSDWMYMTLRRLGRDAEAAELLAPLTADLRVVENVAYHRRLLMYKGEVEPDDLLDLRTVDDPSVALNIATQGYGVGNWYLYNSDQDRALEIFERIIEGTSSDAFGYIAAEAEVHGCVPRASDRGRMVVLTAARLAASALRQTERSYRSKLAGSSPTSTIKLG